MPAASPHQLGVAPSASERSSIRRSAPSQLDRAFRGKTLCSPSFSRAARIARSARPSAESSHTYKQRLDPGTSRSLEITLDPQYDSPAVLRAYGARITARDPENWLLLTGTGSTIQRLLDQFGISSMRVSESNFLTDDKLFIVDARPAASPTSSDRRVGSGRRCSHRRRAVAGLANNPFERFKLALVANAIALCGGSQFAGIALLELSLFALVTIVSMAALWGVARISGRSGTQRRNSAKVILS